MKILDRKQTDQFINRALVLTTALLLGACAGPVQKEKTAGGEKPVAPIAAPEAEEAIITAYREPFQPQKTRANPTLAIEILLKRAKDLSQRSQWDDAVSSLERALRISPRGPQIWNQLAHVRLDQKKYKLAIDMASKANQLTPLRNKSLRKDNWSVIASAKRTIGDARGARRAQRKADQ